MNEPSVCEVDILNQKVFYHKLFVLVYTNISNFILLCCLWFSLFFLSCLHLSYLGFSGSTQQKTIALISVYQYLADDSCHRFVLPIMIVDDINWYGCSSSRQQDLSSLVPHDFLQTERLLRLAPLNDWTSWVGFCQPTPQVNSCERAKSVLGSRTVLCWRQCHVLAALCSLWTD